MPHTEVVTGVAGFIGSTLAQRLIRDGHRVVGVDNFDDYYARSTKLRNLRQLRTERRFTFVRGDLLTMRLERLLSKECRIFHLAAQPGVRGSWGANFTRYARNNVLATQRLLEAASHARVRRFLYASSSSVYGRQPRRPSRETAVPNPVSPYGVTKLAAEHLCNVYRRAHGLSVVSTRFFTVYGPRQRPDMAFHRFFEAARAHRQIIVFGDGLQLRDFTFVDDIVDGIVAAAEDRVDGGTFNLGGGSPATVNGVIRLVGEVVGRRVPVRHEPMPKGEPEMTWADTTAARRAFGFRPKVGLREGLMREWEWQAREPAPRADLH